MNAEQKPARTFFNKLVQLIMPGSKTRAELLTDLRDATEDNLFDTEALGMIEGALNIADKQVRDVMVPRSQMVVVETKQEPTEFLPMVIASQHSRFPVVGDTPDEILGILLAKDLLPLILDEHPERTEIHSKLREIIVIPESKRLNVLLQEFRRNRNHMAIVIDEYGSVSGLITIEDVLEQIVGEIEDEHDLEEANIRNLSNQGYLVKATTSIEEFNEFFNTNFKADNFDTLGGLVTQQFGHVPKKDEETTFSGFKAKVISADERRIKLVQINQEDKNHATASA